MLLGCEVGPTSSLLAAAIPVAIVTGNCEVGAFSKTCSSRLVVPGSVASLYHWHWQGGSDWSGPLFGVGIFFIVFGAAIYVWCVWDFATRGGGTPAPIDAPKKLVASGPYVYSRNPMYVGVLAAIIGWAAAFASSNLLLYGIAVGIGFHLFIVLYEEPHLLDEFGNEYEAYRAATNRWVPNVR